MNTDPTPSDMKQTATPLTDAAAYTAMVPESFQRSTQVEIVEAPFARKLERSNHALTARVKELEGALRWALGEEGEFPFRAEVQGAYWWRTELRRRALLPATPKDEKGAV